MLKRFKTLFKGFKRRLKSLFKNITIKVYWWKKTDQWYLLPAVHLTYHPHADWGDLTIYCIEIIFLNRWVALEILVYKRSKNHE
ncbi:hypothetical protein [Cyclobacterium marinum]|uniref:hypothetical protein n=1 Tax=Cyclobacterium marinum TaxID=104 RepID=UPI0003083FC4|nr:hypothetical protein [Cyclobacterium marinum]